MDLERQQIDVFLEKCDDVMRSKFIIADTKISELLKSIATSDLLYAFFREITKDFDYAAGAAQVHELRARGQRKQAETSFSRRSCRKTRLYFLPSRRFRQ